MNAWLPYYLSGQFMRGSCKAMSLSCCVMRQGLGKSLSRFILNLNGVITRVPQSQLEAPQ